MSPHDALVDALEARRRLAQTVVDACEAALAVFRGASTPEPERPPQRMPKRLQKVLKKAKAEKRAPRAATSPTPRAESNVQRYIGAIVEYLRKTELRSSDGVVIRTEVAKRLGVNMKKDASFRGDMGNALQSLKTTNRITRKGTMWTLTEGAGL